MRPGDIPVVKSDRGGHVTYHGPGQITACVLVTQRLKLGVGSGDPDRTGSGYIAALGYQRHCAGMRRESIPTTVTRSPSAYRKGCSYHGLNFNVSMDLSRAAHQSCGLGVTMTQMVDLIENPPSIEQVWHNWPTT